MMTTTRFLLLTARSFFSSRSGLLLENLALRQQLAVMKNSIKRPRLRLRDRLFWILLSRAWAEWRCPLVKPPSQTWRTFLKNHMHVTSAIDFFAVPTVRFRILFVLIILEHSRRRVVHCNVTEHPCAPWTAQQVVEAFPWESAPRYLLRDRDRIYSSGFRGRVRGLARRIHDPWKPIDVHPGVASCHDGPQSVLTP